MLRLVDAAQIFAEVNNVGTTFLLSFAGQLIYKCAAQYFADLLVALATPLSASTVGFPVDLDRGGINAIS